MVLASLTSSLGLLADAVGEVALVPVGAVPALHAGQAFADAFLLIAEIGRPAGVQPAGDLGARGFGGPWLSFLAARRSDGRALGIRRLTAARGSE